MVTYELKEKEITALCYSLQIETQTGLKKKSSSSLNFKNTA